MDERALFKLSYGMYIVSSRKGDKLNCQVANTVFQVTAEPIQLGVSISKENFTHECIQDSKVFSVSVLAKDATLPWMGPFGFRSGSDFDKFKGVEYRIGKTCAPILVENCVAFVDCELESSCDMGTHTLFIGKVVDAVMLNENECMTYADYREKKGRTPDKAPTYTPKTAPTHVKVKE